jgi:DNA polymerase epsilon subunit 1
LITTVKRVRKEDLQLVSSTSFMLISPSGSRTRAFGTQPNHLMGYRREYIALSFRNQTDLFSVRRDLLPLANKNREMLDAVDTYAEVVAGESTADQLGGAAMEIDMEDAWGMGGGGRGGFVKDVKDKQMNPQDAILDIREYDVPYYLRVAIDKSESPSSRTPLAQLCGGKAESNAVGKLV